MERVLTWLGIIALICVVVVLMPLLTSLGALVSIGFGLLMIVLVIGGFLQALFSMFFDSKSKISPPISQASTLPKKKTQNQYESEIATNQYIPSEPGQRATSLDNLQARIKRAQALKKMS